MNSSVFSLQDRVAIVTGGGTGIGRAIAIGFAEAGADVVVASRKLPALEATAREVQSLGRRSVAIATDVRLPEQVDNLVRRTTEEFGRIDILVNDAGGGFTSPAEDISFKGWDAVVGLNLTGVFLCSQAVAKVMIPQKRGKIISIVSIASRDGDPGMAHYAAAKGGVSTLTQTLAAEWGKYDIQVNAIGPGSVFTEGVAKLYSVGKKPDRPPVATALQRWAMPEEIAYCAIFLASDAANYITGQTIYVDGGVLAQCRSEFGSLWRK